METISDTWVIILVLSMAGALGGLTNSVIAGELKLPHRDAAAKVFRPGWIGNVVVGGVAALVLWGLYGPMSGAVVVGPTPSEVAEPVLRVSELFGGLVTGIGGGRILTALVDQKLSEKELAALTQTKDTLAEAVRTLAEE